MDQACYSWFCVARNGKEKFFQCFLFGSKGGDAEALLQQALIEGRAVIFGESQLEGDTDDALMRFQNFADQAGSDELAVIDDENGFAEFLDFAHEMAGEEKSEAVLLYFFAQEGEEFASAFGVHAIGGLIKDEQPR